jgi:hypothetical protein
VWGLSDFTAVTTEVIPRDVISNEENEVGLLGLGLAKKKK